VGQKYAFITSSFRIYYDYIQIIRCTKHLANSGDNIDETKGILLKVKFSFSGSPVI